KILDPASNRVDHAPALVAEAARLCRKGHPVRPCPRDKIGGANPTAFKSYPNLTGAGLRQFDLLNTELSRTGYDGGLHRSSQRDRAHSGISAVVSSGCGPHPRLAEPRACPRRLNQ